MFSKACEYGIRASIFIAEQSLLGNKVGKKMIAQSIHSPEEFTAKILQILTKAKLVRSERGPRGGFFLDENQLAHIRLSHIVTAIDGNEIYKGCALGLPRCNEKKPCPLHAEFKKIRDQLKDMLESTLIQDLATGLKKNPTFLKR